MRKRGVVEVVPESELTSGERPLVYVGGKADAAELFPGSVERPCSRCRRGAWFVPVSIDIIDKTTRPVTVLCFDCWMNEGSN